MKIVQNLPVREDVSTRLASQTNRPQRILVADDDGDLRRFNAEVLIHSGYEVEAAEDGAVAWRALNASSYDLLVTDNKMPNVTGIELLEKLHDARMVLPVIMATGSLPQDEFARQPRLQLAASLLKPYTAEELLGTVKAVLHATTSIAAVPPPTPDRRPKALRCFPAAASGTGPPDSPHRILVVDADRDLRRLYVEFLVGAGYSVDVARDGATGWKALQSTPYSLLITEHDLPTLTGVELVLKLRSARMALPVVLAAGRLPDFELARRPSLQLAATLVKPFSMDALQATLKSLLTTTANPRATTVMLPEKGQQPAAASCPP